MDEVIELYNKDGFSLVISIAAAGSVGPSRDTGNPVRKNLLNKVGVSPDDVYFVNQQHSRIVVDTSEYSKNPLTEADGLVTENKNECLGVTVADCMPVYLQDKRTGVRALLHSGWKGTGIALNALQLMKRRYGCRTADITAVLGPSIGSCCYNVDEKRAEIFSGEWGNDAVERRNGLYYLSLKNANIAMLGNAGVEEIECVDICTSCDSRFGSFRREGPDNFTLMFVLSYLNQD